MDRIDVMEAVSEFVSKPHKVLTLNGTPLDVLLDSKLPGQELLGLVPALLDWLHNPAEQKLVRERILPPIGKTIIAPLLVCPDDLDLLCTVVVAEVAAEPATIFWRKLGLDISPPNEIGSQVDWFEGVGPYCFKRTDYEQCLKQF